MLYIASVHSLLLVDEPIKLIMPTKFHFPYVIRYSKALHHPNCHVNIKQERKYSQTGNHSAMQKRKKNNPSRHRRVQAPGIHPPQGEKATELITKCQTSISSWQIMQIMKPCSKVVIVIANQPPQLPQKKRCKRVIR